MTNYKIEELIGQTMADVISNGYEVVFTTVNGINYKMYHDQDCCESVLVDEVIGNLQDLVGEPILTAEETTCDDGPKEYDDCYQWTIHTFSTRKGKVTIRWYGASNGYYGVGVDLWKD